MDTNQLAFFFHLLESRNTAAPIVAPLIQVTLIIVAAISPLIAAITAYWAKMALMNMETAKISAVESSVIAKETAVSVEKIHVAVNSEKTAREALLATVQKEVSSLKEEIMKITGDKIRLEEELKGKK